METTILSAPHRCFCQIPVRDLRRWAQLKYIEHASTLALLGLARDQQEREAVVLVALLDVSDDDLVRMMTPLTQPNCSVLACREHVRTWLRDMLTRLGGLEGQCN